MEHRYIDLGNLKLHCVEAGQGPLVVLLHGFPEFWYSWRRQIPVLAAAGFRAVAVDMRGYNLSDKPPAVSDYRIEGLAEDIARLIAALNYERATLIGHDWGAAVAWQFAMQYPSLLDRLAILNVPHPARFLWGLLKPEQLFKSWYMFFFQLPWLPELGIQAGRFEVVRKTLLNDPVNVDAFSEEDVERYIEALSQPGALTAGINYYRAAARYAPELATKPLKRVDAPVLVIWGEQDKYMSSNLAEPEPAWVPNCRVERLPNASHFVQNDRPEEVNGLLLDFLTSGQT